MQALTPVYTADLFPPLHAELVSLLRGLADDDWMRPTLSPSWRVRDVAAHLLDGDLRRISIGRDGHQVSARPVSSFLELVGLINDLNASGVRYAGRLSPRVMTDLLEVSGRWVSEHVASLPPHGPSRLAVAWAGEDRSENWMDTGREYTERWHHQAQVRAAVGAPGLFERRWFHPVMDLSVRAFRRSYGDLAAPVGTAVVFEVEADGEYAWSVTREASGWGILRGRAPGAAASLRAAADTAWKLFYNALPAGDARELVAIEGDPALVEPMLRARAVMV